MSTRWNSTLMALVAALVTESVMAAPLGPAVTYQGQLKQSGTPVSGTLSMEFRLYDASGGGSLIGTQTIPSVAVTGGLFTVQLNDTGQFGANAFNGDARWLEIWVGGVMLAPRQQIAAAPYAHGVRLPLVESVAGSSDLLSLTNTGATGSAGVFAVTSVANLSAALRASANGIASAFTADAFSGNAIVATASAGRAGAFTNNGSLATVIATNNSANGTAIYSNGSLGVGIAVASAKLHVVGSGSSGLSLNVDNKLYVSTPSDFVGINRTNTIGAEVFGVRANVTGNAYGGMYMETSDALGRPFYGYATNGTARAWTWYDGSNGNWSLYNSGTRLTVQSSGNVGIGITSPERALDVLGRIRLRQDTPAASGNSAGIDFYQQTPAADRAFIGMRTDDQVGIYGRGGAGWQFVMDVNNGNIGIGTAAPGVALDVNGTVRCNVLEINGADVAERFPTSDKPQPGTVMEIDPEHPGQLRIARRAYSPGVAGVVSGANDFPAGTILGHRPDQKDAPPIALSGRVYVRCDAGGSAIQVGDMLTTSDLPGLAMKATDRERAYGAVLGKAMTSLDKGKTGLVLVLVSLQ